MFGLYILLEGVFELVQNLGFNQRIGWQEEAGGGEALAPSAAARPCSSCKAASLDSDALARTISCTRICSAFLPAYVPIQTSLYATGSPGSPLLSDSPDAEHH